MTFRSDGCVYFFQYHPCLIGQFQTMLYIHKISLYDFLDLTLCVILRSKNINWFWDLVYKHIPNYQEKISQLKGNGIVLAWIP